MNVFNNVPRNQWVFPAPACVGRPGRDRVQQGSAEPVLVKGLAVVSGDDQVIQYLDLQPVQHFLQFAGEFLVVEAGAGLSVGMVVRKNHRSGIVLERASRYFSWIDSRARQGPLKQGFTGNQTVSDIEE